SLRQRAPRAAWIGSGGIRDDADIDRAAACGAHAWLVASALHAGRIAPRSPATDCGAAGIAGHTVSRPSAGRATEGPAPSRAGVIRHDDTGT
ncbi:hypothetical protein, partial [Pantoea agglomerans]|uniref:hypothetical protein n=1 Tax=Enterobacter agglomerans TaxID=549 RepID=UPI003CF410FD